MTKVVGYPSIHEALGTSIPVVTALLAAVSVALFVVPLAVPQSPAQIVGFMSFTTDQPAVVASTVATLLFVAASVLAVHAQAAKPSTDMEDQLRKDYQERTDGFYASARSAWMIGFPPLFLTLGALGQRSASWLLAAMALISAVTTSATLFDDLASGDVVRVGNFPRVTHVLLVGITAFCICVAVASILA